MSYGFAGALQGLGGGMMKLADERRQLANDLLKMEKKAELDKDVAESRAASTARHRRGRGGSGGSGRGGPGYALNPRERDDLARAHKGMLEKYFPIGNAPTEAQLGSRVEQIRGENRNLSLSAAIEQAASEWRATEVETTEAEERSYLNPRRYVQGPTYEETTTETVYGFNSALGEAPSDPASEASPAPSRAPERREPTPQPSPKSEQALTEARAAIASGADRNAVISRLQEMGIDPKGL